MLPDSERSLLSTAYVGVLPKRRCRHANRAELLICDVGVLDIKDRPAMWRGKDMMTIGLKGLRSRISEMSSKCSRTFNDTVVIPPTVDTWADSSSLFDLTPQRSTPSPDSHLLIDADSTET